jgi:hypothetical protein
MKLAFNILLIFAVFNAFTPIVDMCELAHCDSIQYNYCCDSASGEENQNNCTPLCQCFNILTLPNISLNNLSLEVKFIHYHSNTNKFIEQQTEPVFRPPIA